MTTRITAQVGRPGFKGDHVIRVFRPNHHHHTQPVGQVAPHDVNGRQRGWTVDLYPYLEDALTEEQRQLVSYVTGWFGTLNEATDAALVATGVVLSWWMSNQLPRNTFADLETPLEEK